MNFLIKSISNFQFPYTVETENVLETPFWDIKYGMRKSDSLPVTLFVNNRKSGQNQVVEEFIKNATHRAKTLKIPGLVRVLDVIDSDLNVTYIVTEYVQPLYPKILPRLSESSISLGLLQVFSTLRLLHDKASIILGTVSKGNVYLNERGEWCLFGLELCMLKEEIQTVRENLKIYSCLVRNTAYAIPSTESLQIDSVHLAGLIKDVYCSKLPKSWQVTVSNLSQGRGKIGETTLKLGSTAPMQSPLICIYDYLKEIHIKDTPGKLAAMLEIQNILFENPEVLTGTSPGFVDGFLVPMLSDIIQTEINIKKQKVGERSYTGIISLMATLFELSCSASPKLQLESTFEKYVKRLIFDNYKISDRQLRFLLLIYLSGYVNRVSKYELQNEIFPYYIQGLADTDSSIRFQTLKRASYFVDKITDRQLNSELLRHLAKTQVDPDPEIRMWTILTISDLSEKLSSGKERSRILAIAFGKSLKDNDVLSRLAALYGMKKCIELFDEETIANKILSTIAPGLLDNNRQVRNCAKELFEMYLKKLVDKSESADGELSDTEYIEVDFDAMLNVNQNELVINFLENLKISSKSNSNLIQPETVDDWDSFTKDDCWGEIVTDKPVVIDAITSLRTNTLSVGMKATNTVNSNISRQNFSAVKVQKSWNDDLNNGTDTWNDGILTENVFNPRKSLINKNQIHAAGFGKTSTLTTEIKKHTNNEAPPNNDYDAWGDDW